MEESPTVVESLPQENQAPNSQTEQPEKVADAPPTPAKKKKKKKKKANPANTQPGESNQKQATVWTPPNYNVPDLFPNGDYPCGEIQVYKDDNLWRSTSAEKRELERLNKYPYESIRLAAEVHRRVRKDAQSWIKPGMKMIDICKQLEATNRQLVKASGLERGIAFPTGCSINRTAAHYTPNTGDDTILSADDVVKFDFGTHVNGYIIDCAWTMSWNPQFDPLVAAAKEATNAGIREAGIDVRVGDIGAVIQEVMESYEVKIGQEVFPVKSIRNLTGHSIEPYMIHGAKKVPIVKGGENTKMEEGEFYAIETFGSTGKGRVVEEGECSHYMKVADAPHREIRTQRTRQLLNYISKKYSTLAFCRRWLDEDGQDQNAASLRQLVTAGLVSAHPPLVDIKGSYTSQFEHTILLRPTCKEVISRGDDY